MATFVGGMGSPVLNEPTGAVVDHGLGAPAASAADAAPFAADALAAHGWLPTAGQAQVASSTIAQTQAASFAAQSSSEAALPHASEVVLPQADASGVAWFAAGASHVDAPVQWFANTVATTDMFSAPALQTFAPVLPSVGESFGAAPVASGFSDGSGSGFGASHGWSSADDSFVVSELPFMHDLTFDDTPVYTASVDTPWIFVADFTGDGWLFA